MLGLDTRPFTSLAPSLPQLNAKAQLEATEWATQYDFSRSVDALVRIAVTLWRRSARNLSTIGGCSDYPVERVIDVRVPKSVGSEVDHVWRLD